MLNFLAALAAQADDSALHTPLPFLVIISAFVMALIGLAGWALSLERRKLEKESFRLIRAEDREDFRMYSSKLESRLQAMHSEVLDQIRDVRDAMRHVEQCPYLDDIKRRGQE